MKTPTWWKPLPKIPCSKVKIPQWKTLPKIPCSKVNIPYLTYQNTLPLTLQIHTVSTSQVAHNLTFKTLKIWILKLLLNPNHMYQVFTYICTSSHEFITIYAQIIIKQHTSKNTIKILIYTQLLPNTFSITHSKIKLKTQQILISLIDKCHYPLIIYLHMLLNPNTTDL